MLPLLLVASTLRTVTGVELRFFPEQPPVEAVCRMPPLTVLISLYRHTRVARVGPVIGIDLFLSMTAERSSLRYLGKTLQGCR